MSKKKTYTDKNDKFGENQVFRLKLEIKTSVTEKEMLNDLVKRTNGTKIKIKSISEN